MICASTHRRGAGSVDGGAPVRSQSKTGRSSSYTPNLRRARGDRGHGYLVQASSVARVRLSPTERPSASTVLASSRVSSRRVCALPSKPPHGPPARAARARRCGRTAGGRGRGPAPRSRRCPAGDPSARDRSRATWATSRLWVSRLRTKSSICGPCTWVLAASRRDAAAWTTRARSRSYGVRSGASTRLGGSATSRSRSWASYSSVLSIERDSEVSGSEDRHVHVVVVVGRGRAARRHARQPSPPRTASRCAGAR